jgi:hypothetical protein
MTAPRSAAPVLPDAVLRRLAPADRRSLGKAGLTADEAAAAVAARGEKELQQQCAALLRLRGYWFAWSATHRRTTAVIGTPDFLFAYRRRDGTTVAVAWECKTTTGRLSDEQARTHEAMRLNGWTVVVVRSLEDAKASLPDWREAETTVPTGRDGRRREVFA